jgi:hypothetical protein
MKDFIYPARAGHPRIVLAVLLGLDGRIHRREGES